MTDVTSPNVTIVNVVQGKKRKVPNFVHFLIFAVLAACGLWPLAIIYLLLWLFAF